LREAYRKGFEANLSYAQTAFRKAGADLLLIGTGQDNLKTLTGFFRSRERRR
jgi:hypothetical protein